MDLTRRIILGIVNTCHDPLGLFSPITVQLKLHMRDLFSKELGLDWDTSLPQDLKSEWLTLLQMLKETEKLVFSRPVRPETAVINPDLLLFWDGCAAAYVEWPTTGEPVPNLLCAKTRVSPLNRISTPRAEM